MLSNPKSVIAIVGPTCTGKSELALHTALRFNGEIINADSMQVYKHFDIGTAKPDADISNRKPHHLIDIVEPKEDLNAALFKEKADEAIDGIWARGKTPVLVGGTGLYMRALVYGLFKAPTERTVRDELKRAYEEDPSGFYETLMETDRAYAMRVNLKDKVRVVRAMEVHRLTGQTMSDLEKEHGFAKALYRVMKVCLVRNRDDLYRRIDARVDEMLRQGWMEEVKSILSMGYEEHSKPFSGIGYRDLLRYIKDEVGYEDMVETIKKETSHYGKR